MLDVCAGWCAALLAAPQLVPTVYLRGPDFKLLDSMFKPRAPAQRRTCPHALARGDEEARDDVLWRAALISRRAPRVHLWGFGDHVGHSMTVK